MSLLISTRTCEQSLDIDAHFSRQTRGNVESREGASLTGEARYCLMKPPRRAKPT
jgi:hypothetical protein